jgi:tetratricopeptide (TPR) repeat protein
MDYTAIGDTINLASRMQSSAQPGAILVSGHTQRLAKDFFAFSSLGPIQVKGKEEPQDAYKLVGASEAKTRLEASAASGLTRFVGRAKEMETLHDALDKARSGRGQVVGIVGEAGVGKSRIIFEMRHMFPEYTYLEGRCLHYGGSMAYLPLLDILRSYFGVKEGEREYLINKKMKEKLASLDEHLITAIAPFQDLLSLEPDEAYLNLQPKQKQERISEALRDLFIRESQQRPLVLIVEDLHWIDKTSEEFLDYLIGWLATTPILLIILYRPEYTHRWGSRSFYTTIRVDQLSLPTSAELVQSILSEGEIVPELRDLILGKAAGNPLFMEELTHSLLENGSIQKEGDHYILSKRLSDIQVPDTIQGIIAARIDRLDESLKRIMHVASVIGREFAFRILQSITEMKEELKGHLINLQGLELIYEKRLFPELEYIFKHALTQEVAYNSLLLARRKEIHGKIGRAIEELYADRLEEFYEMLAYHYVQGEDIEKAGRYLTLSGNKAAQRHSLWEAHSFYKQALAAIRRLPETEERKRQELEVLALATMPLTLLAFPEGSLDILKEGEMLSKELKDHRRLALFYGRLSGYYSVRGNHLLGIKYSEDAFEEGRKGGDLNLIVPIAYGLCFSYLGAGQFGKLVATARGVLDLLEKRDRISDFFALPVNPYAALSGYCGMSLGWMGSFQEGEAFLEKAMHHGTRTRDVGSLAVVEFHYGVFCHTKGDFEAAAEHHRKCVSHSEEVNQMLILGWAWSWLGTDYTYLGDPETGRTYGKKGLAMQQNTGNEFFLGWHYLALGDTHLHLGDLKNARVCMEEAVRLSQKNGEKIWEAE